jgi:hypothetical protein
MFSLRVFFAPKSGENTMSTNDNAKYNDQHITGMGYLNRARTVSPLQGQPYESVSLTGLGGKVDQPVYTYYDCSSVIGKALDKYLLLKESINNADSKVLIRFKVSDPRPDSYVTKDSNTGQDIRRHVIKGKLLNITWASIDGQVVEFELDDDNDDGHANEASQPVEANGPTAESDHSTAAEPQSLFSVDELDEFVKLSRDDPQFLAKKSELKSMGYQWDSNESAWFRPAA